jgi:glutamine amidotransferase
MIAIVSCGMGNPASIKNMLLKSGTPSVITSDPALIAESEKLILPGVGAFDHGMERLKVMGLLAVLNEQVLTARKPVLGICLGMQILCAKSEEGVMPGLGWLDAEVIKFKFEGEGALRVPHMGWNTINPVKDSPLLRDMPPEPRFYFVHSYHVQCKDPSDILTLTEYGHPFTSMVSKGNIMGTQFHPEKSHKYGMKLLQNFSRM